MLICAASNNKRPEKEQPAGNTKSNMMRLWPANYSTCHVSSLCSDQKLVATHVKINKTNRDVLKTKNVLPKNSMRLFITIGIMIPQHGWDVSPGWDPYPPCKACHCCSHTYQKQCNECLAITSATSSASFKDAVQGLISGKVAYGSLISQNLTYSIQGETCSWERKWLCCCGNTFKAFNPRRLSEVKGNYGGLAKCKCFTYAKSNVVFKEVEALKYW